MFRMAMGFDINFSFIAMKTVIKTKHYLFFMNLDKKKSIAIVKTPLNSSVLNKISL